MSWPTPHVNRLIDAMTVAEGGPAAMVRAVQISVPSCRDYTEARAIALNSICHALWDYVMTGMDPETRFIMFLGMRWAPVGAENDPHGLNKNWVPNVVREFTAL